MDRQVRPPHTAGSDSNPGRWTLDVAADDTDVGWGDLPEQPDGDDDRILREVPPHHLG